MRFLITFLVSGLIYYALYAYLPDVFNSMVVAADKTMAFIEGFVMEVMARVKGSGAEEQFLPMLFFRKK